MLPKRSLLVFVCSKKLVCSAWRNISKGFCLQIQAVLFSKHWRWKQLKMALIPGLGFAYMYFFFFVIVFFFSFHEVFFSKNVRLPFRHFWFVPVIANKIPIIRIFCELVSARHKPTWIPPLWFFFAILVGFSEFSLFCFKSFFFLKVGLELEAFFILEQIIFRPLMEGSIHP